jgi:hypothetical protein
MEALTLFIGKKREGEEENEMGFRPLIFILWTAKMEIRVESVVNTRIACFRRALLKFENLFFSGKVFGPWILKKSTVGIVCSSVTRIAIRGQCFHGNNIESVCTSPKQKVEKIKIKRYGINVENVSQIGNDFKVNTKSLI